MTHTLHRLGTAQSLANDYVVLAMAAKGINEEGAAKKLRAFLDISLKHNPVNYGDMKTGNALVRSYEEIVAGIQDVSIVHAVFTSTDQVVSLLSQLKEANLGVSVVVSGLVAPVAVCCHKANLRPHTVEYSLGVWGRTERLPDRTIREITTMCGHGQVASGLVETLLKKIRRGKMDYAEAAKELAKQCVCGVFNTERAEALLREMAWSERSA